MKIVFSLELPRDEASVPVVRHICRDALIDLGVVPACVSDIELATSEACTNVLKHVEGSRDSSYEVTVEVNNELCEIRVIDTGGDASGFDGDGHGHKEVELTAESGRGIFLMRALVDDLKFISQPELGTVVHLTKQLALSDSSVLRKLATPTG